MPLHFYAVHRGKHPGIYSTWPECRDQVKDVKGAVYKKFKTKAEAESFVKHGWNMNTSNPNQESPRKKSKRQRRDVSTNSEWPFVPPRDFVPDHTIYTDGGYRSVKRARGPAKKLASIGVYFGPNDSRNVSARVGTEHTHTSKKQTNNVGELCAILEALKLVAKEIYEEGKCVLIGTDSQYAIRCATTYGDKCAPGGIKENDMTVPNRDLVLALHQKVKTAMGRVQFIHIRAHTTAQDAHSVGNREADALATNALLNM